MKKVWASVKGVEGLRSMNELSDFMKGGMELMALVAKKKQTTTDIVFPKGVKGLWCKVHEIRFEMFKVCLGDKKLTLDPGDITMVKEVIKETKKKSSPVKKKGEAV